MHGGPSSARVRWAKRRVMEGQAVDLDALDRRTPVRYPDRTHVRHVRHPPHALASRRQRLALALVMSYAAPSSGASHPHRHARRTGGDAVVDRRPRLSEAPTLGTPSTGSSRRTTCTTPGSMSARCWCCRERRPPHHARPGAECAGRARWTSGGPPGESRSSRRLRSPSRSRRCGSSSTARRRRRSGSRCSCAERGP